MSAKQYLEQAQQFFLRRNFGGALEALKEALKLEPNNVEIYINIAKILIVDYQELLAKLYLQEAIKIDPNNPNIIMLLAEISNRVGDTAQTLAYYKRAVEINPSRKDCFSAYFFTAYKCPEFSLLDFYNLAKEYNQKFLSNLKPCYSHSSKPNPNKEKLKIGFVSPDLRKHPVAYYLKPVLQRLDRSKFDIYLFATFGSPVAETKEFEELCNTMFYVQNKDLKEITDTIYKLKIDVLFDLTGYTSGERMEIFKLRPAPVQVSHIGYFGTLGIPEIDYILADPVVIKPNEHEFFTEKVYYLDGTYTHCNLFEAIVQVDEAPCVQNKFVTFGSMNTSHKISEEVIKAWSEILLATPDSRLLIDSRFLISEMNSGFVKNIFLKYGIPESRLIFEASIERGDFIKVYNQIDIALDPFPYTGGTSTIEALYMGVPVVTWEGTNWIQRMSASHLTAIGHTELITHSLEEYKTKIIELAKNSERINEYRKNLRQDMQNSNMNVDKFAQNLEVAIFDIWQRHCRHLGNERPL